MQKPDPALAKTFDFGHSRGGIEIRKYWNLCQVIIIAHLLEFYFSLNFQCDMCIFCM